MRDLSDVRLGVIGLGYVGLPLAAAFGRKYPTLGFDVKAERVAELTGGCDTTLEVPAEELRKARHLRYTAKAAELRGCNTYVVTVPTPVDAYNRPDLTPLIRASETIAAVIEPGDVVIYESTVYPGATEECCIPVIERLSGLRYNRDFFAGYSPERINPGDKQHRFHNTRKVTAGSTPEAADFVDALYASVVEAGTHQVSSIRAAEAAKVIENTQRDLNIALVNEFALIFNRMGLDTLEVLEAAGSKWNFLPFRPGLVGGHCIGVDPYYLTHKAQALGYHPEVILAGRRINDGMGAYVAEQVIKLMTHKRIQVVDASVLVMGLAFKENCTDLRNTRVIDIVREFEHYNARVDVYDPWVDIEEARREYGLTPVERLQEGRYDAIILAVAHRQFADMGASRIRALARPVSVLYDVKSLLPRDEVDGRL